MEYIKKEELIKGEIYTHENGCIVQHQYLDSLSRVCGKFINQDNNYFPPTLEGHAGRFTIEKLKLATPEEKHWLNCCITADRFITFEEAMKTFIPEYVEWIDNIGSGNLGYQTKDHFKKNKIFKTDIELPSHGFQTQNWIKHLEIYANNYKPSTKEGYDAQFIVKEPEFVLPKKWCIRQNKKEINDWLNQNKQTGFTYANRNGNEFIHFPEKNGAHLNTNIQDGYTEITFEQFKKYVLKEEVIEEKVIEPLPQFKVIETIETITKVENNEGNQFFIGDVVESEAGIIYTINGFKYNDDKTDILATTIINLEININKIEHYIEPKVEFILPEKWGILRTNENDKIITDYINKQYNYNHSYLFHNKHNPYLHNKIGWSSNYKLFKDHVEITFDQFKKYVLKEEQPIVIAESVKDMIILKSKGINSIILPQESLLEKAKRLYPIGTKVKTVSFGRVTTIETDIFHETNHNSGKVIYADNGDISIYSEKENRWAEIIK